MAKGADWYWNPKRWRTDDGYVPWTVMWSAWRALQAVEAAQRLEFIRAYRIAQPREDGHAAARLLAQESDEAYPEE